MDAEVVAKARVVHVTELRVGGEFAEHLSANDPATGKSTYISRDAKGNTYYLMLVGAPALGTKRRELWVRKDNIHAKKIRIT